MKILYLVSFFPFPPHSGGALRVSNIIQQIAPRHQVHMLALDYLAPAERQAAYRQAAQYCASVLPIPHQQSKPHALWRQLRHGLPYELAYTYNPAMQRAARTAIARIQPDVVLCSRLAGAQFLPPQTTAVTVLDQHDLSRYLWQTFIEGNPSPWIRMYARINQLYVKAAEQRIYRNFDLVISVSEAEREMTAAFAPPRNQLLAAPNGVDIDYFRPDPSVAPEPFSLVLTGEMQQRRNVDAALFLCQQILPLVRERYPQVRCFIVGRKPTPEVQSLAALPGVTVTGAVPDVRPYLAAATVAVAPYRFGSGVKHKIPIALAMGKPLVATTNAIQGIALEDRRHGLIADDAAGLADAICTLLGDAALCQQLSRNARQLAVERYSWVGIVQQIEQAILGIAGTT